MPIPPDFLPILKKSINEDVRPLCDMVAVLAVAGADREALAANMLARLQGLGDDEVVDDGRLAEGIAPPTVGQLRAAAGFLSRVLPAITTDPAYPAIRFLATRNPQVM